MKAIQIAKLLSILTALLLLLAGTTVLFDLTVPSLVFGFLLVPSFILFVVYLARILDPNKIAGMISIVFATMYGTLISFNYFLEFSFIGRDNSIPNGFYISDTDSIFWVIEILGYFFMGLATLALIPLFKKDGLGKSIKFLFLINGLLGFGGIISYTFDWDVTLIYFGLMLWNLVMPLGALLVYFYLRKNEKQFKTDDHEKNVHR